MCRQEQKKQPLPLSLSLFLWNNTQPWTITQMQSFRLKVRQWEKRREREQYIELKKDWPSSELSWFIIQKALCLISSPCLRWDINNHAVRVKLRLSLLLSGGRSEIMTGQRKGNEAYPSYNATLFYQLEYFVQLSVHFCGTHSFLFGQYIITYFAYHIY